MKFETVGIHFLSDVIVTMATWSNEVLHTHQSVSTELPLIQCLHLFIIFFYLFAKFVRL